MLESDKFLEQERKRQKKYYVKTAKLSKKELVDRRLAVKERVQKSRNKYKRLCEQIEMNDTCASSNTDKTITPFVVSIKFPKRGESSRKRKRRSDDKLYQKIAKLKEDKKRLERKCDSLRKKISRRKKPSSPLTPKTKTKKMLKAIRIRPNDAPEISKQLLFAEAISLEIQEAGREKKNKKENIRTMLSGKILKKYRLLKYTAAKTTQIEEN